MQGGWCDPAVTPEPEVDPRRVLRGHPYYNIVMRLALAISKHEFSQNQITTLLEILMDSGDECPYTDRAKAYMPRNSADVLACLKQIQAIPAIG